MKRLRVVIDAERKSVDAVGAMFGGEGGKRPEGLLDAFSDQQVRDLFAYLRTTQPLAVKAGGAP